MIESGEIKTYQRMHTFIDEKINKNDDSNRISETILLQNIFKLDVSSRKEFSSKNYS